MILGCSKQKGFGYTMPVTEATEELNFISHTPGEPLELVCFCRLVDYHSWDMVIFLYPFRDTYTEL